MMNIELTKLENFDAISTHLVNIVIMNNSDEPDLKDEELMDFDFDYDPNEMYYDLINQN
ncbi:hypothetical protein [Flavobacterium sp.]|uniref:hypothetical protein n=1 Tax=Flavobacterium sp. TaxID=239 RepID=UPI0037C04FEF